jgi:hypothetical protein
MRDILHITDETLMAEHLAFIGKLETKEELKTYVEAQVARFPFSSYVRPKVRIGKNISINIKATKVLSPRYRGPDYYDKAERLPPDMAISTININASAPLKEQAEKVLAVIRATKHLAESMSIIQTLNERKHED